MRKNEKGITLVDLLVLISILALLMTIVVPALPADRQQAIRAVCRSNLKGLTLGYLMYTDDYEYGLMGGYVPTSAQTAQWNMNDNQWVFPPFDSARFASGNYTKANTDPGWRDNGYKEAPSHQDRITGLKMGVMWNYAPSPEMYHCPGDQRAIVGSSLSNLPKEHQYIYRSYSIPDALAAHKNMIGDYNSAGIKTKLTEIGQPSKSYVIVEESMPGSTNFNYNHGGWSFQPWSSGTSHRWWDTLGTFHDNMSIFSFADGHVEPHKWEHKETAEAFKTNFYNRTNLYPDPVWNSNQDFLWLWRNYPDKHPVQ